MEMTQIIRFIIAFCLSGCIIYTLKRYFNKAKRKTSSKSTSKSKSKSKLISVKELEKQRLVKESFRRAIPKLRSHSKKKSKKHTHNSSNECDTVYWHWHWYWHIYYNVLQWIYWKVDQIWNSWKNKDNNNKDILWSYNPKTTGIENVSVIAIDCEMVGVGFHGKESMLARCSIVKWKEKEKQKSDISNSSHLSFSDVEVIYDRIIQPTKRVVDYRTQYSGITPDMFNKKSKENITEIPLISFAQCQRDVSSLFASLDGKPVLVVGHDLRNDFAALRLAVS